MGAHLQGTFSLVSESTSARSLSAAMTVCTRGFPEPYCGEWVLQGDPAQPGEEHE